MEGLESIASGGSETSLSADGRMRRGVVSSLAASLAVLEVPSFGPVYESEAKERKRKSKKTHKKDIDNHSSRSPRTKYYEIPVPEVDRKSTRLNSSHRL